MKFNQANVIFTDFTRNGLNPTLQCICLEGNSLYEFNIVCRTVAQKPIDDTDNSITQFTLEFEYDKMSDGVQISYADFLDVIKNHANYDTLVKKVRAAKINELGI